MSKIPVVVLFLSSLLAGCSGPCNAEMLKGFKSLRGSSGTLGEYSVMIVRNNAGINGQAFEEGEWRISKKDDSGCNIAYTYKLNGQAVVSPVFYVEIQSRLIYPADQNAQTMMWLGFPVPPWGPIP